MLLSNNWRFVSASQSTCGGRILSGLSFKTSDSLVRVSVQGQILLLDTLLVADNDELARLMSDLKCQMSSDLNLRSQMFIHA